MKTYRILSLAALIGVWIPAQAALAQSAADQLEASPRHHEWVTISPEDGDPFTAFVAYPERNDAADSVVAIHDIRGMGDWIRLVGDQLAQAGHLAVVPDFLSGAGPDGGNSESFADGGGVGRAIRTLDPDRITSILKASVRYARALHSTTKVASVGGFCWGGSQTFRYATNDSTLKASFVFYGSPPAREMIAKIASPVYGFYGQNDNRINSTIEDTKKAMAEEGKTYEPLIYDGVGHGFLKSGMAEGANDIGKARVGEAWKRWLGLLAP